MVQPVRPGDCQVWWSRPGVPAADLLRLLAPAERRAAARLRYPPARHGYLLAHATARAVAGALTGQPPAAVRLHATCRHCAGPHGRPRIAGTGLRLSLSRTAGRVAVAVCHGLDVGVDVEREALCGRTIPVRALSAAERAVLLAVPEPARLGTFIGYWTRKEAVLKATGDGLVVAPAELTVSAPAVPPAVLAWPARPRPHTPVSLVDLHPGPGYRACLAVLGPPPAVAEFDATDILRELAGAYPPGPYRT